MSAAPAKVLFVSSESRPFASTGGLSDVSAALPNALNRAGQTVDRVLPLYHKVRDGEAKGLYHIERTALTLPIPMGAETVDADIYSTEVDGTRTYFIGHEEYFDRSELYALPHREYRDNFSRFLFFQKAVVALIDALGKPYELIHLNDWQTGLIPLLLEKNIHGRGREGQERCLYTIHNLAYQGVYSPKHLFETNLPGNLLEAYPSMEFYGQINMMKAGLMGADQVSTVSPTYAREILTPEFGCGMEGVLNALPKPVQGILNGVDTQDWDPSSDPALPSHFTAKALKGKDDCKKALLKEFKLDHDPDLPLLVMITRLVEQKGVDLLKTAIEKVMAQPVRLIVLGAGQEIYQNAVKDWAAAWPDRCGVFIGYDVALSHRLEAGGDFFLMPSRFEPCGLNQMYSLRYGTLPIVSATGGLLDTVTDLRSDPEKGTGFIMESYTPEALLDCVQQAVSLYNDRPRLRKARQRAIKSDVSWDKAAETYIQTYRTICG